MQRFSQGTSRSGLTLRSMSTDESKAREPKFANPATVWGVYSVEGGASRYTNSHLLKWSSRANQA